MKRICFHIALVMIMLFAQTAVSQDIPGYRSLEGSWLGKIPAGGISLRVIFNLTLAGKDSLTATLDSPDQGAKNIKIGPVSLKGNEINIKAPLLLGEYKGIVTDDTLIKGDWTQAGRTTPLELRKLKKAFTLSRPQEPKPPFPYLSEDITFVNDKAGIELAGTLTIPDGRGPFAAVILVTGSGAQNRNEELLGHKPFWVIADFLSRNGIAVLRYDDRGVGKSRGTPLNATSADFATDAEAAFLYMEKRKEINSRMIGFAGHSEGGLIAPMAAFQNHNIAFIISLAGPGVKGEKIIQTQNFDISMASGMDIKQINENISTNKKLFGVLKKEKDNKVAEEKIASVYREILVKKGTSQDDTEKAVRQLNASLNPVSYNWMRYFLFTDPATFWKKVKCPVLALNGEKDLQVSSKVNLPAIEKALKSGGNKSVTTVSLPELNHLFQHSKTGLPSEYGEINETFSPEVLKMMKEWILGLKASPQAF